MPTIMPGHDTGLGETGPSAAGLQVTLPELVKLGAVDTEFYAKTFFPKTFRQASPPFARDMWGPLEDPDARFVNLVCFRGSSKTTRLRVFTSKRIAYGISKTVLYVGASEAHAIASVQWIRNQVDRNKLWAQAFGLRRGRKWEETQIVIEQYVRDPRTKRDVLVNSVWVLAAGITGSIRGINFDDYRPDTIVIDDPQTDESAATEVQREKITDLVLGAIANSLAPVADEPNAKLAMAITPQQTNDISQQAIRDTQWVSRVFPCWTRETLESDIYEQKSAWEERFPTVTLREQKQNAIARNKLSIFTREMECRLISRESSVFSAPWIEVRPAGIRPPVGIPAVLGIDPVPPPSPKQVSSGLQSKDMEAHYVWGLWEGKYHLLDRARSRGHQPNWTISTAMELAWKWRVMRIVFEAQAYQRSLEWLLGQEMARRRTYFVVKGVTQHRKKFARIENVIGGLASNGLLAVGMEHTEFLEQFQSFGPTYDGLDDDLDASAIALEDLSNPYLEAMLTVESSDIGVEEFPVRLACP